MLRTAAFLSRVLPLLADVATVKIGGCELTNDGVSSVLDSSCTTQLGVEEYRIFPPANNMAAGSETFSGTGGGDPPNHKEFSSWYTDFLADASVPFTMEAWVNPSLRASCTGGLWYCMNTVWGKDAVSFAFGINDGKRSWWNTATNSGETSDHENPYTLYVLYNDGEAEQQVHVSTQQIPLNSWTHVAVSNPGKTTPRLVFHVNGTADGAIDFYGIRIKSKYTRLGNHAASNGDQELGEFAGSLSGASIYRGVAKYTEGTNFALPPTP
jgi:hypothetical protein